MQGLWEHYELSSYVMHTYGLGDMSDRNTGGVCWEGSTTLWTTAFNCMFGSICFLLSNKFQPSVLSLLHPLSPHSVSVSTRSEWGYGHSGTWHHGPQHPLQPPVYSAACARLPPERLHPRQHSHPHFQPPAAAGYSPAGHPAGTASAPSLGPARAPQSCPDSCLKEEVYKEGEEVDQSRWMWNTAHYDKFNPAPPSLLGMSLLRCPSR